MVEKVIRGGKVAVLVSPGFGAGWSTWNDNFGQEFFLMDAGLIELYKQNADKHQVEEYIKSKLELEDDRISTQGWDQVEIQWVPVGKQFYIKEYDGSEEIVYANQIPFVTA